MDEIILEKKKNNKHTLVAILLVLGLISITLGVSVAFFNYTRTGNINTVATGKIYFNTTQDGNISLTNIFPMSSEEIDNVLETGNNVTINIEGDTSYDKGVEYLVTAEDVNIEVNEKKIPLNLYITSTNNLGNNDDDYFDNRGSDTSLYKVLSGGVVYDGQYLLVGYIAPGQEGIEGNLNIKAYIDKDKIAITDTPEENIEWQRGRTVFSTSEWNSLNASGTPLSFKIRVEANEGVWVDPYTTPNLMNGVNFNRNAVNVKEIRFIHETPLRMQRRYDASVGQESNGTKGDLTYQDTGKVLAWIEPVSASPTGTNNELLNIKPNFLFDEEQEESDVEQIDNETSYILYIASSGETKWVTGQSLFGGFTSIEKITFENVDSSGVTTMSSMFVNLSNLVSVGGLNKLDTGNVTNMSSMFYGDTNLKSIDLSGMGSDVLSSTASMFSGCTNLESINMSGFNFGVMTTLYGGTGLFQNLTKLTSINLNGAKMENVQDISLLFSGDTSLMSVNLSGLGSDVLSYASNMFSGCTNLKNINMSNFNFGKINMSGLSSSQIFYPLSNVLETVNLSGANFSGPNISSNSFNRFFQYFEKLKSVDFSNANTSKVTTMNDMFGGCKLLEYVNLDGIDTSEVTNMSYMFDDCDAIIKLDLKHLNTTKVTNMRYMFRLMDNLEEINISGWGNDNLSDTYGMFDSSNKLKTIIMDNFNFGTNTNGMFRYARNVEKISLNNVIMNNLTDMSSMFISCTKLISLDLSSFVINNVINMSSMFYDCSNLETIYVSNSWNVSNVTSYNSMFYGCTSLVGGNGTVFDSNKIDKTMAVIDTPTTPGYLTLKNA